jgi:hypothetical protein
VDTGGNVDGVRASGDQRKEAVYGWTKRLGVDEAVYGRTKLKAIWGFGGDDEDLKLQHL